MATFYLKSGAGAAEFVALATYASGDKMVPARSDAGSNSGTAKKWVWECTTAGTAGATNPTWGASVTQDTTTVTSGTATFTARKPGFSSGTTANWAFATIYADYVASASAAGDTIYVSQAHNESISAGFTITFPGTPGNPSKFLCVNDSAAPPTASASGAVITCSANNMATAGSAIYDGIRFKAAGSSGLGIQFGNTDQGASVATNCAFEITGSNSTGRFVPGTTTGGTETSVKLRNCTVKFGQSGQGVNFGISSVEWIGGGIESGSTAISTLGVTAPVNCVSAVLADLDLSAGATSMTVIASAVLASGVFTIHDCKMPASWSGSLAGGAPGHPGFRARMINCDSADTNYRYEVQHYAGSIKHETTLVRTGGATDGTTAISWKIQPNSNCNEATAQLVTDWMPFWVGSADVGVSKTATIEFLRDSATNATDAQVWAELVYPGTSGNSLGVFVSDQRATAMTTAADQTASSVTWTTTGMSNPNKQKASVSYTPQRQGVAMMRLCVAMTSGTVYADCQPVIT